MAERNSSAKQADAQKDYTVGIAIVIAALLIAGAVYVSFGSVQKSLDDAKAAAASGAVGPAQTLSNAEFSAKVESYLNKNFLASQGMSAKVTGIRDYDAHIKNVSLDITRGTETIEGYVLVSSDAESLLLGTAYRMNETIPQASAPAEAEEPAPSEAVKADRPKATAYIMSYCPYGLQFLKAYVPVMELLGNKSDLEIGFVSYAMHGQKELEGNSYIYCVQKEAKPKLTAYLRCFVESGDYKACLATAGVAEPAINSCVAALDTQYNITGLYNDKSTWASGYYPQYNVQKSDNLKYGVQGSPTFIVNGAEGSVYPRSAANVLKAVCDSFTTPPAECSTALSTTNEAPSLGKIGMASATDAAASCG